MISDRKAKLHKAIRYYNKHPVEFVEDIIRAKPDEVQAEILRSVEKNKLTTVRSGHGVGKSTVSKHGLSFGSC